MKNIHWLLLGFIIFAFGLADSQTIPVNISATVTIPDRILVDMTNNVLSTPAPRTDLFKSITGPTAFTMGTFSPGSVFVLLIRNPNRFPLIWPAGLWSLNSLPTNEVRSSVVFEEVRGEIWVSQ